MTNENVGFLESMQNHHGKRMLVISSIPVCEDAPVLHLDLLSLFANQKTGAVRVRCACCI